MSSIPSPSLFAADRRGASAGSAGSATADLAACREQLRDGSRTFLAASRLLPRPVRDSACALYAFCRVADDEVDLDGRDELAAVGRLRARLGRIYADDPAPAPADRVTQAPDSKLG